ncbi:hypothetical protein V3C99_001983 [Haemonchus contortus]
MRERSQGSAPQRGTETDRRQEAATEGHQAKAPFGKRDESISIGYGPKSRVPAHGYLEHLRPQNVPFCNGKSCLK